MAHKDNPFATATIFKAARAGISLEESIDVYNEWASAGSYDEVMNDETYKGASSAAKAAEELFPSNRENRLILDVCCGTGLIAEKLQRQGFKRIHGLDGSTGMLDLARPKNIYEKLICCFVDASPLPMDADTYDCALIAGGMCEGHIPTAGLRSLVRVIKPGGFIVMVMREAFLWEVAEYKDRLEKEMETMEKEGLWQKVSRTPLPNYFHHHMGVVFIFRKS